MAKGKHSVALFEVIQAGKSSSRNASFLSTPKWWFKNRKPAAEAPAVAPPPALPEVVEDTTAPAPRVAGIDLKLDPDTKRIRFDASYTSVIVAAFTVVVFVGLAYIVGTHISRGPTMASAGPRTVDIRNGPAQPAVLMVGNNSGPTTPPIDQNITTPAKTEVIDPPPQQTLPVPAAGREIGLNYVVVQSYPTQEKEMAFEASDFLNHNGLLTTVETGVTGYPNLFVVVGLQGFAKPRSDPAYAAYENKIRALSDKFAKDKSTGNGRFKRFNPLASKWTGTERTINPG